MGCLLATSFETIILPTFQEEFEGYNNEYPGLNQFQLGINETLSL